MTKRILIAVGVLALVVVSIGAWTAWTFMDAEQHLQKARAQLGQARVDLESYDAKAAQTSITAAQSESGAAAQLTNRWVWRGAAALPVVGDSAAAARSLVLAANSAVTGLAEITDGVARLDLKAIVDQGSVNLDAVAAAGEAAKASEEPLAQAQAYLSEAPRASSGAWVLRVIEDAHTELTDNIAELSGTASVLQRAGVLLPPALGADGPKTYFVAVQAPNETRGTGGLLGTWAVVRADDGKITVLDSGANEDLPNLPRMPDGLEQGFLERYLDDPTLVPNMNMSPDFPMAAKFWLESWEKKTGERLDGVVSLDVTAVGQLLGATGTTLTGADGASYDGAGFADFALRGIYDKFPAFSDTDARRAYQDQLGVQATEALFALNNPEAVISTLADLVDQRRIAVWVADPEAQTELTDSLLGHSLTPARPHSVEPVLINVGWSKLDTYIDRTMEYVVGRCPSKNGSVRSELKMTFVSDIPLGSLLPEYAVGTVPKAPTGPVNQVYLQAHLPPGAEIVQVYVDGKESEWQTFEEAGRPITGVLLPLPPREPREVRMVFDEPGASDAGEIKVQPMARDAVVSVRDRGC